MFQHRIRYGHERERQEPLWYRNELPETPGHPFYKCLNEVLERAGFDRFCEGRCGKLYHEQLGRPSLAPGQYFRLMMIGFFEGIDSERGLAWRVADSLTLRHFLQIGLDERTPDHVTISRGEPQRKESAPRCLGKNGMCFRARTRLLRRWIWNGSPMAPPR